MFINTSRGPIPFACSQVSAQEAERGKLDAIAFSVREKEAETQQQLFQLQHNCQSANDQLHNSLEENSILKQRLGDAAQDSTRLSELKEEIIVLRDKVWS